jgi:hypothetical protein
MSKQFVYVVRWSHYDLDGGDRIETELAPGTVWTNPEQPKQLIERETHEGWEDECAGLDEGEELPEEPMPDWRHVTDVDGEYWEWDNEGVIVHRVCKVELQGEI